MAGPGRERGELVDPGQGLVGVAGADGCFEPVDGGHPVQGRHPHPGQVVQRCRRVALRGGAGALGPSGDVVRRAGHDAQRVSGRDVLEGSEVVVEVVAAGQGGQQGQGGQWCGGQGGLADAARQRQGFVGRAAHGGPRPGGELGEHESFQGVDDDHAGPGLAGGGHHGGVVEAGPFVVAEVQGGVAEVAHHVQVLDLASSLQGLLEGGSGASPVLVAGRGQGPQQQPQARGARGVLRRSGPAGASALSVPRVAPLSAP